MANTSFPRRSASRPWNTALSRKRLLDCIGEKSPFLFAGETDTGTFDIIGLQRNLVASLADQDEVIERDGPFVGVFDISAGIRHFSFRLDRARRRWLDGPLGQGTKYNAFGRQYNAITTVVTTLCQKAFAYNDPGDRFAPPVPCSPDFGRWR